MAEFKAGMTKFIEEARSVARGMELIPERAAYEKRVEALQEVYSRIPEPPEGNKAYDTCHKAARQIAVTFEVGSLYLKLYHDFLRLNSESGADDSLKKYKELGNRQKTDLKELEAATREGRMPNIELSDVIKGKK